MALNNFFKINLPYGIKRNNNGHWAAFNREYKPLGDKEFFKSPTEDAFIYTNYGKLSDKFLMQLADDPSAIQMDENNVIKRVFFYDDATNPSNHRKNQPKLWNKYFEKIRLLSKQKRCPGF
jgi:hypothetical protein